MQRALDLLIILLACATPLIWRYAAGSSGIDFVDSWAYRHIFETFHRSGHIDLIDWNDITLVGVLPVADVYARVFGTSNLALRAFGSAAGFVALLGARHLLGTVRSERSRLALVVGATFTGFVGVAGLFGSDLPAFAAAIWMIALTTQVTVELRSGVSATCLVVSSAMLGALAFSIRQQTAPAAVGVMVMLWLHRKQLRHQWIVFGGVYGTIVLPFYVWRTGLPRGGNEMISIYLKLGALRGDALVLLMVAASGAIVDAAAVARCAGIPDPRRVRPRTRAVVDRDCVRRPVHFLATGLEALDNCPLRKHP